LLGELPSDSTADLMGTSFDRRKVEFVDVLIGTEDFAGDRLEKSLELGVAAIVPGCDAKHVGSSLTELKLPRRTRSLTDSVKVRD